MIEKELTYLEKQTEASLKYDEENIEIKLHQAKIKLRDVREINLLKTINPEFKKELIKTDDQLTIRLFPPASYERFQAIQSKSVQAKWRLAYNIIQLASGHSNMRLKLIISPENIMFDQGLIPHLLHYGVKESIPPYEDDQDRLWLEIRSIIATIADQKYDFTTYLSHYETIELSDIAKQIMAAESFEELTLLVNANLQKDAEYESTVIHIPTKKYTIQRYTTLALIIFLIPTLIYTAYAIFFKIPETEAYVEGNQHFLQSQYSAVVDTLGKYNHENMPYGVQYQLASSYVENESLTKEQRRNVQNTITLQSDQRYFSYWIHIGKGNNQEAIDIARLLEDRDLIIYGLLKQREEVKADESLDREERKVTLDNIGREIDEYQAEMEEEAKEAEAEKD